MLLKRHLFLYILLSLGTFTSCKDNKKTIKQTEVSFTKEGSLTIIKASDSSKITLDIEIADTDYDIQTGLMYRDRMLNTQGMLFVFDNDQERSFYMKNTKIALDLIYINSDKEIVSFQENAKPFDESSLPSNAPAQYVLEVNAGLANTWELAVGDHIQYAEMSIE
ncbi:DUF192 domain-containing protein [Tamlana sp. 2_MG-2023]|uniref:DUF192 domain-containing protein n=1 Tax=unclassified Tamlana TaxID=2614803 RepID=UPI0026E1A1E3|nr:MULTISPECIES: DUF192 domain-containing protein [unclassified Tamlana]MDO6760440.1 DUF192 domain-containing protein [Tamlana sp. 2_MG-2023]MDO6789861.1 DUF192 domain-containing protein [Tamlana sp. 1_MG-2023]